MHHVLMHAVQHQYIGNPDQNPSGVINLKSARSGFKLQASSFRFHGTYTGTESLSTRFQTDCTWKVTSVRRGCYQDSFPWADRYNSRKTVVPTPEGTLAFQNASPNLTNVRQFDVTGERRTSMTMEGFLNRFIDTNPSPPSSRPGRTNAPRLWSMYHHPTFHSSRDRITSITHMALIQGLPGQG
ncbi:hypothetical protein BS17DRAFT_51352 [Gyrodon lividus]|nr:hypothetical protein BS17DRAFT_51352 [Gyrodon lividus]